MPGIKEAAAPSAEPRVGARRPLVEVFETSGPIVAALPDPAPYQNRRDLQLTVPGGVVTVVETYWTAKGLRRWLRACPKEMVQVRLPTGIDPRDPEAPKSMAVYYDGYRFDVPYEKTTSVPAPIAEIVRHTQDPYPTTASRNLDLYAITPRNPNGRLLGEGGAPQWDAESQWSDDDD
jgi:hypothetical protein